VVIRLVSWKHLLYSFVMSRKFRPAIVLCFLDIESLISNHETIVSACSDYGSEKLGHSKLVYSRTVNFFSFLMIPWHVTNTFWISTSLFIHTFKSSIFGRRLERPCKCPCKKQGHLKSSTSRRTRVAIGPYTGLLRSSRSSISITTSLLEGKGNSEMSSRRNFGVSSSPWTSAFEQQNKL
jgi:hypothetical protein